MNARCPSLIKLHGNYIGRNHSNWQIISTPFSMLQGKRAAVCTDNVTDVSSKDDQSDAAPFVNSVDSFICQSTIIPADGRGFRMAISSQSISLADTFVGTMLDKLKSVTP